MLRELNIPTQKENESTPDKKLIAEAAEKAKDFDKIVVFAGLTDYVESEGCARENMRLPENQLALIKELRRSGKRIVGVLFGGGAVGVPFSDSVNGILDMFLPGQNGRSAVKALLFGEASPSGRLAEIWAEKYEYVSHS